MILDYVQDVLTYFRNLTLNAVGRERDLYQLIQDGDIGTVLSMCDNNDKEVDKALSEYNPQTHNVMYRRNKVREGSDTYISEKLPRTRQRYINEVELFFLLGRPVKFTKKDGEDEAFRLFTDFLSEMHFDARMRTAKRLAGAETESAKLYRLFKDEDKDGTPRIRCQVVVLARTTGYKLRPYFDQYGNLTAFACGYKLRGKDGTVRHWDIYTKDFMFFCTNKAVGWEVSTYANPIKKIPVLYYRQLKAWDGVQPRIEREESLDSKIADTNNYFADPMAQATVDVIDSLADPDKPGKLIQLTGSDSRFEYINPPQNSETRSTEQAGLRESILFDTYTPDFSYENIRGLGTLSGAALKNAMILGRIKRMNRIEIYGEMLTREISIIKSVLEFMHPDKAKMIEDLKIDFEFSEPFDDDEAEGWGAIINAYSGGVMSMETAVRKMGQTDKPEEEVERIRLWEMDKMATAMELKAEAQGEQEEIASAQGETTGNFPTLQGFQAPEGGQQPAAKEQTNQPNNK